MSEDDKILTGVQAIMVAANEIFDKPRNARQIYYALETGRLPGKKFGGVWSSTRNRIRAAVTPEPAVAA